MRPHALVFPWPGQGHITPMMNLSRKLVANGIVVTFVNTEYNHLRMLRSNSSGIGGENKMEDAVVRDMRFVGIPDGLPPEFNRTTSVPDICLAVSKMHDAFQELVQKLIHDENGPPVTCIISDIFVLFTQDVANKFRIPRIAFWTQSAVSYALLLTTSRDCRPPIESGTNPNSRVTCIPGAPPLRDTDLSTFLQTSDTSNFMLRSVTDPFHRLDEAACILMNTVEELESITIDVIRREHKVYSMGPLFPPLCSRSLQVEQSSTLWPENLECLQWLDQYSPSSVLYVSFGSLAVLSVAEIEELAYGLEASQLPFLWVVRPDVVNGGAPATLPAGFKERTSRRAFLTSWAPQLQVLSHPSIGGFFTHYGWNSTLESIATGVPMVGLPFLSDQPTNCRCVVDGWKIGLRLEGDKKGRVSGMEVEAKVRTLMGGKEGREMRERAVQLKELAGDAMWEVGKSANLNVQCFVKELGTLSLEGATNEKNMLW